LISALDEKGRPTPLAATLLRAPMSRMDVLTDKELKEVNDRSSLVKKYGEIIDRESAYEILNEKIETAEKLAEKEKSKPAARKKTSRASTRQNPVIKVLTSATFIRGVLGVLKKVMR
jgi:hypothetical protein